MDVSIIIPTYNRLWCLEKAISSCKVTRLETEIIVIDDGSDDGTLEWLKKNDLKILFQENAGKDWAVNKGVSISTGKYIRFLDSDDWIPPYSSDQLFEKAEHDNLDVVCSGHQVYTEDETFVKDIPWVICDDLLAQQLGECDSSHYSAYLFKSSFIKEIPHRQEYAAKDDRKFIIEVALKGPKYGFISAPALAHRIHSKEKLQAVSGLKQCVNNLATLNIYKSSLQTLKKEGRLTTRYKKASINVLWPLSTWVAQKHLKEGETIYKWILELDPQFQIPEKGILKYLYNHLGFKRTQQILRLRRILLRGID